MARRYVNPGRSVPDSPANLADWIDAAAGAHFSLPDGPSSTFRAYAAAAMQRDPGLTEQLRQQLGAARGGQDGGRGRYGALAALYGPDAPGAALNGQFSGWGEFAAAAWHGSGQHDRLRQAQNAMDERIPAEGGFLVPEELRSEMVLASLEEAICRPLATVIPSSTLRTGLPMADDSDHSAGVTLGGLSFAWAEEAAPLAASNATYGRLTLEAKKLACYSGGVPNELTADAAALEAFFLQTVPKAYAWAEDEAFIAGLGVGDPQGILNARCAIEVTRQGSDAVTFTDVIKMLTRVLPQSMTRFVWLASPDVLIQLLELYLNFGSATSGIAPPPDWLKCHPETGQWTLLGRPFYPTEHVPALGATGDLVAVDLAFLVIADRQLMQMDSSSVGQGYQKDETEFRFRSRLDARVWLASAITPANSSETVSPVVVLN